MKIAVLGCSWSAGIPRDWSIKQSTPQQKLLIPNEDFVSWPRELAKLNKDLEIHNYALPGSSLLFSIGILENIKQHFDVIILQVTTADRYTSWAEKSNLDQHLIDVEPNYKMFGYDVLKDVVIYDSHFNEKEVVNSYVSKDRENQFINYYYYRTTDEMFNLNHKVLVNYAKDHVDIIFAHRKSTLVESVEETLGTEAFENYFMDEGAHFGLEGCQWQAKWVLDKINTL